MGKYREETIGDARLILGDCLEVMPTLDSVDVLITDPPYGVGYKGSVTKAAVRDNNTYLSFDDTPENIETEIIPRVTKALSICGRAAVTPGIKNQRLYPKPDGEGVIWYPSGANCGPWGFVTHQPIYYYGKCPFLGNGRGSRPTGFQSTEPAEKNGHPCPKPVGQMKWIVNRVSNKGETVLDIFLGSGSTGIAAIDLGRKFIGIEIEPKYFDIACRRIEEAQKQLRLF